MDNILIVIEELGTLIKEYKQEIKFKDIEIQHLKNKIEYIEQAEEYYSNE